MAAACSPQIAFGLARVSGVRLSRARTFRATRVTSHSRLAVISNRLVLSPTGDGSCEHLDKQFAKPGPIELREGLFEVGREEPADIVVPIPTVSSRHCMLKVAGDRVSVTDLNSTNGTFIDDEEVTPMKSTELPVGSEITFGDVFLAKFQLEVQPDAPELQSSELPVGQPEIPPADPQPSTVM